MSIHIIGVDNGILGGMCVDGHTIPMPVKKTLTKEAIYVFKDKNPKVLIKSGPNKGTRAKKLKRAAKYRNKYDMQKIWHLMMRQKSHPPIIYLEALGTTIGNSSAATKTTQTNYGRLLAVFEILGYEVVIVTAAVWKKHFGLNHEKEMAVNLAEELSGLGFRTEKGALRDGEAESYLIYRYGLDMEKQKRE